MNRDQAKSRNFLWTTLLSAFALGWVLFGVNRWIDRYYVFHSQDGVFEEDLEPNMRVMKARYLKKHCGEFDAVVVGSSRAAAYRTEDLARLFGVKAYNYGVPAGDLRGIRRRLEWLSEQSCLPNKVFLPMSIDRLKIHPPANDLLRKEYPAVADVPGYEREFWLSYLGADAFISNLRIVSRKLEGRDDPRFRYDLRSGDTEYYWDQKFDIGACPERVIESASSVIATYADHLLALQDFVGGQGAQLILIWNPVRRGEQIARVKDASRLIERVSGDIRHVYRLPLDDPMLIDSDFYHDPSHFKPEVASKTLGDARHRVSLGRLLAELKRAAGNCG